MLNRPLPLSFYVGDHGAKASAYNLLLQTLSHKAPALHAHLAGLAGGGHDAAAADAYLCDALASLFTASSLSLDEAARLWDVYVFEGDAVLVRAGVALLARSEMALLGARTVAEVKAALARPRDPLPSGGAGGGTASKAAAANAAEEETWIRAVREAGKS